MGTKLTAKYQTGGRRFLAAFVDGLIFTPIILLDVLILAPGRPALLIILWLAISYPAAWLYPVLLHGFYGQTIGKRVSGVRVVDNATEGPISMRQAFMRDIVIVIVNTAMMGVAIYLILSGARVDSDSFTTAEAILMVTAFVWVVAEVITWLTNEKRRAIHDFIAGTVVIKTDARPSDREA